jgi:tyrosine-protein kinase Etk/Wzc
MAELEYRTRMVEDDQTISLLDILSILVKRRRGIILFTAIVTLVAVGYFFLTLKLPTDSPLNLMPDVYKPTVKVLLGESTSNKSGVLSSLNSANLGSLAALAGLSGSASGTSADLAQALLKGKTIQDQIAGEFDFQGRYRIEKNPKTSARSIVAGALSSKYDSKSKIMEISFKETDREFATQVLNRTVELLESSFRNLTQEKLLKKKAYLEDSLTRVRGEVNRVTGEMITFQKKYNIVDLSKQASEQVQVYSEYGAQLIGKRLELQGLKEYLKDTDPQVVRLNNEIRQLELLMQDLQRGSADMTDGLIIPQQDIPELSVLYLNIKREMEIQQTILSMLMSQYETTKLEEMDTSDNFQVIEKAEVPETKDGPARAKLSVIVLLSAFFVSVLFAFVAEYFVRVRKDPVESVKLAQITSSLSFHRPGKTG